MAVTDRIDLTPEIQDWLDAELGEDVRDANVRAFEKIQTRVNDSIDHVNQAATDVGNAAGDAAQVAKDADATVIRANQTVDHADDILDDATAQAGAAADSAKLSQSWAAGGTGTRQGEGTNNSEFYSNQSRTDADRAKNEADRAAQYSKIVAPGFYFDPGAAGLYMKSGVGVDFMVSESRLYWKITA